MTRLVLALLLAAVPAHAGTTRSFANPTPAPADFFGSSVATTGAAILIGARFDDPATGLTNAGAAHLFDAITGARLRTWTGLSAGDQLGFAVATLGADLLVSAPERSARAGAVYRFTPGSDAPVRTYTATSPGAKLGYSIAALGSDVLAGAPYDGSAGGAYLFDGSSGALLRAIPNPTPEADDQFGRAVAAAGDIAAVAAPYDDAGAPNAGVVHLFAGRNGAFLRTLASPKPRAGDGFGLAVAADATRVLVGCPYDRATPTTTGAAYLFDATTGALLQTFLSPVPDGRFGAAVALAGNLVVVGAPFADGTGADTGETYVFDAAGGTLLDTLASPTPRVGAQFGVAVAVAGPTVVVGAWLDDTGADNTGAAYQFLDVSLPTTSTTTSTATTTTTTSTTTSTTNTTPTTTTSSSSTTTTATTTTTPATAPGSLSTTTVTTPLATSSTVAADPCGTGLDAVICRLDALDATLHTTAPLALGGPRLTARLQRKIARARRLVDAARTAGAPPRILRRANRALAAFIALVERGQRVGRIAHVTAEHLLVLSTDAAVHLAPWMTTGYFK